MVLSMPPKRQMEIIMEKRITKFRALVIDDNEVNAIILTNMLKQYSIAVDQAEGGAQAITMSQNRVYDIVFVDHIMPKMNGIHTVTALRRLYGDLLTTVIIALTSTITESTRILYREAGANDVYEKPLGLAQLDAIFKKWYPGLMLHRNTPLNKGRIHDSGNQYLKELISRIDEISDFPGNRYVNSSSYGNIMEVFLKDMKRSTNHMKLCLKNNSLETMRFEVHSLIGVFAYINAKGLFEEAKSIESAVISMDIEDVQLNYLRFIDRIGCFQEKLNTSMEKYYAYIQSNENESKEVIISMTKDEYEQSILNTIYYIKRFEYDAIIHELEQLIVRGQKEFKKELENALMELKEYNYEKALGQLVNIKNKIGI